MLKADLHCHTNASDNSFSIEEVVKQAKAAGLTHLAITDHDTTAGIQKALLYGEQYQLQIIPGIEISASDPKRDRRAHILGLYIDPHHPALDDLCKATLLSRHEASKQMVSIIADMGYNISWELVSSYAKFGTVVYKQHIMHALMDLGYCDEINGELQKKLFSRSAKEPGKAFIPLTYPNAEDAIRAIRMAGGVAVLAHPGQFGNFDAIEEWVSLGLQGVEAYHPTHSSADTRVALQLAAKFNLVVTGGADYHGFYGSGDYPLGSVSVSELFIR
ncbi:PHP domain-containing protein [Paenibacillus eucommiae]|uniref:Metal-dependent phosphoesterase TrpH n=1 Tax=Paenibacillus eucommiae TaxID=1355755 RepID=A0ABS4IZ74_9BACL|nr:PHP domain-containing protein [Paenibacillus eucommiae]MBP1992156.1 putative metal-dependent phosphoesterase TrpH [Paenibacillus eucommiae]